MIYIGLDDTDVIDSRGTGHLARQLAADLAGQFTVYGLTRHQLLVDPRVPCTAKNSSATIHLQDAEVDLTALGERVVEFIRPHCPQGSDPGVCVARAVPEAVTAFGGRVKREIVTQGEARKLGHLHGLFLRGLDGTEDGVIGALASVGLAAGGEDGRFIAIGAVRELTGPQPIAALLAAGVAAVEDLQGQPITEGQIETARLRPALRRGRPIVFAQWDGALWQPVRLD